MNFRGLFDDLRRFARPSSVIELGSAFALATVGVGLVVRWNREDIFGDETFRECPHCLAEIPAAASVCSWCTRNVARPAPL